MLLQWGRNKIVTEISEEYLSEIRNVMLQWGRNKIVTEIGSWRQDYRANLCASMGP